MSSEQFAGREAKARRLRIPVQKQPIRLESIQIWGSKDQDGSPVYAKSRYSSGNCGNGLHGRRKGRRRSSKAPENPRTARDKTNAPLWLQKPEKISRNRIMPHPPLLHLPPARPLHPRHQAPPHARGHGQDAMLEERRENQHAAARGEGRAGVRHAEKFERPALIIRRVG